ncbi:enhancer of polycomb-like-domain-containing protein [Russula emetica]|nr:enhancer of polycomb-like-domain-containing protein [Russula emetica]
MPRAHNPGPSTLRNRNRVTNKTRLHIVHGSLDADPLAFDEDEEKARIVSTAGVDAEDANEHHLQAVLSAASQRHATSRTPRGSGDKPPKQQDAYIPIPDNAGLVEDYESLYPPNRWRDPVSYFKTSETTEETTQDALAHGFTYFMDERDKEWLDKNNEEARGEGTSAQGAVSTSSTTRTSQRSAKAKGKEPDVAQPIVISEDEFELVMGLFEKVTHEKTEFLHHGLEQGSPFPPFSDYQETFSSLLRPDTFAAFIVPSWIPQPPQLLRFAKAIYPYWKERRVERGGHRIIPTLNFDESDVKNESYICFRRRDVKAMRKTRASQASSSEKLMRLKQELATTAELVSGVLKREQLKREASQQAKAVWEKREDFASLKRKFPSLLNAKEDEELFYDKERVVKKARPADQVRPGGVKLKSRDNNGDLMSPVSHHDTVVRPKERAAVILAQVDREMARIKERDHHWEDGMENAYQPPPVTQAQRHFKWYSPPEVLRSSSASPDEDSSVPQWRAVRVRRGRGGVLRVDRRTTRRSPPRDELQSYPWRLTRSTTADSEMPEEESTAEKEVSWRIRDRWLFDADDEPSVGPDGPDEKDRVLVDEFHPKYALLGSQDLSSLTALLRYLLKGMSLYQEDDHQRLTTDPTIYTPSSDGRLFGFLPYRTGIAPAFRRDAIIVGPRPHPQTPSQATAAQQHQQQLAQQQQSALGMPQTTGTPISMQQQLKKLPSALNVPQMRISSNGNLRPLATPVLTAPLASPQSSPTPTATNGQTSPVPPSLNGSEESHSSSTPAPQRDSATPSAEATPAGVTAASPMPIKPTQPHAAISIPNGYHIQNNFAPSMPNGTTTYLHPGAQQNGLTVPQIQLKGAFTNGQPEMPIAVNGSRPAAYIVSNGSNFNLPVGAVGVNVGTNLTNNLKLQPSRVSPPRGGQTPTASPSLHQQQMVSGTGATY